MAWQRYSRPVDDLPDLPLESCGKSTFARHLGASPPARWLRLQSGSPRPPHRTAECGDGLTIADPAVHGHFLGFERGSLTISISS